MTHSRKQSRKCPKCNGKGKLELDDEKGNRFEIPCPECWNRGHKVKAPRRSISGNPLASRGRRGSSGRGGRGRRSSMPGAPAGVYEKAYEGEIHPTLGESYEPALDPEDSGADVFEPPTPEGESEPQGIPYTEGTGPEDSLTLSMEIDDSFAPGLEIEQGQDIPLQPGEGYEIPYPGNDPLTDGLSPYLDYPFGPGPLDYDITDNMGEPDDPLSGL